MKLDMIEQVAITASNHVTVKATAAALVSLFAYFFDIGLAPAMLALFSLSLIEQMRQEADLAESLIN